MKLLMIFALMAWIVASPVRAQSEIDQFNASLAGALVAEYDYLQTKCDVSLSKWSLTGIHEQSKLVGAQAQAAFDEAYKSRTEELERYDAHFPSLSRVLRYPSSCRSLSKWLGIDWEPKRRTPLASSLEEILRRLNSR